MRRHSLVAAAGLLAMLLTAAAPTAAVATLDAPTHPDEDPELVDEGHETDEVDEPPYAPHSPRLTPCRYWTDRCTVAPGTVEIAWTLHVDDDHPADVVSVTLSRRGNGGVDRVYSRQRVDPSRTSVRFQGLDVGDQVRATVLVTGPGGNSSAAGDRFTVHDVTPTAPIVGIDDATRAGQINVWIHPAIDVPFYGGELTYQLQRKADGVWTTTATGTWSARSELALPDRGCPISTVCTYRVRSSHPWGASAWSSTASQRSLPVPTAPRATTRASAAGRVQVTTTPTTIGQGTWYVPHRFEMQRDTGSGWAAWSSGGWVAEQPVTRTDGTCPISRVCRYRVRTHSAVGNSPWTTVSQRSMGPPTSVRNLTASSPKARSVTLRWDAPSADAGRPVERYEIWSGGNRLWRGTSRNVTLTGQPAGSVRYQVRAVNTWGKGPYANRTVTVRR